MDLIELSKYLLDEKAAEEYLIEKGVIKTFAKCIRCESEKLGKIRRGKIKCYECKYEWKQTKGSILEECRISASKFLGLLKLFELEIPAYKAAKLIIISESFCKSCYNLIRLRIITEHESKLFQKDYFHYQVKVLNNNIRIIPNDPQNLNVDLSIKRIRDNKGNIQFYLFQKDKRIEVDKSHYFSGNEIIVSFLRELNSKLSMLRKVHYSNLPLYIKEAEFRFNNRRKIIFDEIINQLSIKN